MICCLLLTTLGCGNATEPLGDATKHYLAALDALDAGDQQTALAELTASIELSPDAWAYYQRAKILAEMDE